MVGGLRRLWHVRAVLPQAPAIKHHFHPRQAEFGRKPGRLIEEDKVCLTEGPDRFRTTCQVFSLRF